MLELVKKLTQCTEIAISIQVSQRTVCMCMHGYVHLHTALCTVCKQNSASVCRRGKKVQSTHSSLIYSSKRLTSLAVLGNEKISKCRSDY